MTTVLRDVIRLKNGKVLTLRPLDACKLLIDTAAIAHLNVERDNERNVLSVSFEGQEKISIGDEILITLGRVQTMYKIQMILVEKKQTAVILFSSLPNKTSTFLIPILNKTKLQLKIDSYFVNAYISDCHEYLCLLYRYTGTNLYKTFEESMITDKLCVRHIEYDKYHVMYLFKIPTEFKKDIEHFLEGNYSKFTDTLKYQILKYYNDSKKDSVVAKIIYKSPDLKKLMEKDLGVSLSSDMELASKPDLEKETYKIQ